MKQNHRPDRRSGSRVFLTRINAEVMDLMHPSDGALAAATEADGKIETWREYLPSDCVDTMIKLGWDRTV